MIALPTSLNSLYRPYCIYSTVYIRYIENFKYNKWYSSTGCVEVSGQRSRRAKKNIALKIETYKRLERFLLELARKRGRRLTFDDAVSALLDEYERCKAMEVRVRDESERVSS